MAEKLNLGGEKQQPATTERAPGHAPEQEKRRQEAREAEQKHAKERFKASQEVEAILEKTKETRPLAEKKTRPRQKTPRAIKKQQYRATMRRVESQLPAYQKVFSKIINNQTVDALSNVAGKTIARPSGLLGGALAGFIGLSVLYFNARRIGFEYSSGAAIIFFITLGWLVGILVEYIYGALKRLASKR